MEEPTSMTAVVARIMRAGGKARVVPTDNNAFGLCKVEAQFGDGWQVVLEGVSRAVGEAVIKQAQQTKRVIID